MVFPRGDSLIRAVAHFKGEPTDGRRRPSRNSGFERISKALDNGTAPRTISLTFLVVVALALLGMLAACGSDAPTATTSNPQTDSATPAPTPTTADTTTAGPTSTRASQTTSASPGTAALTPPPLAQGSDEGDPATATAMAHSSSTGTPVVPEPTPTISSAQATPAPTTTAASV